METKDRISTMPSEERKKATELLDYLDKNTKLLVENRLTSEIGPETKRIMQKVDRFVQLGKSEEEIIEQIRNDFTGMAYVTAGDMIKRPL